jgi:hypothetical protein
MRAVEAIPDLEERIDELRDALEGMVNQYAYDTEVDGVAHLGTGGLSSLEYAFEVLGWNDPHPCPWRECEYEGCRKSAQGSYCAKHWVDWREARADNKIS